jgi:hypothetical protein
MARRNRQDRQQWDMGHPCPGCGGPLTTPKLISDSLLPPVPRIGICCDCIYRVLVMAEVAHWLNIQDNPLSQFHEGHEQRMARHIARAEAVEPTEE